MVSPMKRPDCTNSHMPQSVTYMSLEQMREGNSMLALIELWSPNEQPASYLYASKCALQPPC
jgi:hypothetical protein